jgi:GAF domain-containing protein
MAKRSKSVPRPPTKRKTSTTGNRAPRRVGSNKLTGNPRHELIGARQQLGATSEVLQIFNASPGDFASVFEAVLERAMRLCEGAFGFLTTYDGDRFKIAAEHGVPPALAAYFETGIEVRPGDGHWRLLAGEDLIHSLDQKNDDAYRAGNPLPRTVVDLGGARSALVVALRKDRILRGAMTIYRKEVQPFSAPQVALLQHFAAQAVIAIENVRLFEQARSALRNSQAALTPARAVV